MKLHKVTLCIITVIFLSTSLWGCAGNGYGPSKNSFSIESAHINEEDEHLEINVEYPVMKGFPSAEGLNSEIKEKIDAAIKEVRDAAKELEGREGFSAFLNSHYQYFHNDDIVSLWINFDNYLGGAHGMYWIDSYAFNIKSGEQYRFPDLFISQDGVEYVTEKILQKIKNQNSTYFDTAKETVLGYDENFNFIILGDSIEVYFPLYEIAPYVAGIQNFSFSRDELQGLLKPEIYDAMSGEPMEMPTFIEY